MRRVEVVAYNPGWPQMFEDEARILRVALGIELVAIHHIGSTAIPGLCAKPIIDLLAEARDIDNIDSFNPVMEALGYIPKGEFGIPRRRFFIKGTEDERTHHLHIFQTGGSEVTRHLLFRDYLRTHPEDAAVYARLKQKLALIFPEDIESYISGKDSLIREMDRRAVAWQLSANTI
jgi:GrpB-like predicted nucleotidyltransferase (UPF0157 family)